MAKRRTEMYEYRSVIYRLKANQSMREIAQETKFGRNKIKLIKEISLKQGWLTASEIPDEKELAKILGNHRPAGGKISSATPFAELIKRWINDGVNAKVIFQHLVTKYNFSGKYNCIQRFAKQYKASIPVKMTVPLIFQPGEAAQVDFGKGPRLFDERIGAEVDTWFFVMTLCWSRHQYAELIVNQDIKTWLQCHQNAFEWFGGVVRKIIIDNPKCAITKASYTNPEVQRSYEAFALEYGFIISACPPYDPQKKGRVESGVKYIKNNFMPLSELRSIQNGNKQLKAWVLGVAGNRNHGSVFEKPLNRFREIEFHQLISLPTTASEIAVWQKVSLYRDCHIRYLKCCYSAPHTLYGEELWAKITDKLVYIYHNHQEVAVHARIFKAGGWQTQLTHLPSAARQYFEHDASWCITQSQQIGQHCATVINNLLNDETKDLLRQAQSILRLEKTFGAARLELACQRAVNFKAGNYQTINAILKEGLDYELITANDAFDELNSVYTGQARFQRTQNLTKH